ncbi:MAG: hypothetical protein AB7P94_16820 [Steroidobacteraceae bacterium]
MSRKNTTAPAPAAATEAAAPAASQAVESTDEAQAQASDAGITEATEAAAPAGVVTTEGADPEAERAFPDSDTDQRTVADVDREIKAANAYRVTYHVKTGGTRFAPGDVIPVELVTPALLASGAVVKA